jgi:hypothetical protein
MGKAACEGQPNSSKLHNFVVFGRNRVNRTVTEVTKRCTGCGRSVTTTG